MSPLPTDGVAASTDPSDVRWMRPGHLEYATMLATKREREDRSTAKMVLGLSLACTLLCIYDMFLLAGGV
jgi:hypothetical protein